MTPRCEPTQLPARWPHDHILHAWWVEQGRMLAGEHPELSQEEGPDGVAERLTLLADAGIVTTVDLASRGSPQSGYGKPWLELGRRLGRKHRRLVRPIDDRGVIGGAGYLDLIAEIDSELAAARPLYVHCAYGVGRTGTVVGVWLRRQGLDFDETMRRISAARAGTSRATWPCPDTDDQRTIIRLGGEPNQGPR